MHLIKVDRKWVIQQAKTGLWRKACKVQIKNIEMLRIYIEVNLCKQILYTSGQWRDKFRNEGNEKCLVRNWKFGRLLCQSLNSPTLQFFKSIWPNWNNLSMKPVERLFVYDSFHKRNLYIDILLLWLIKY